MGVDPGWLGWGVGACQPLSLWSQPLAFIYRAEYECFQIELSKNYGMTEWREDVKKVLLKAGLHSLPITFLFSDTQVQHCSQGRAQGGLDTTLSQCGILKVPALHAQVTVSGGGSWRDGQYQEGHRWVRQVHWAIPAYRS